MLKAAPVKETLSEPLKRILNVLPKFPFIVIVCGMKTGEVRTVTPPAVLTTVVLFGSLLSILSGLIGKVKTSIVFPLESANSKVSIHVPI